MGDLKSLGIGLVHKVLMDPAAEPTAEEEKDGC